MKKSGLYLRVSTEEQVTRDSLPTQEKLLRKYCEAHNLKVVKIYREEGESAKDTNRPKLNELKTDVAQGLLDAVVILRVDRITRSNRDLWSLVEFFTEHDTEFISITENFDTHGPVGRFMLNMLSSLAQMEREMLAQRVTEAMYSRAEDGKWNGGVIPYGYTTHARLSSALVKQGMPKERALAEANKKAPDLKRLYVDAQEAQIVRKIYEHYIESRSLRGTVSWLNANGFRTRKGKLWASSSVHRILSNPTYVGSVVYGKRTRDINSGNLKKNDPSKVARNSGQQAGIVSKNIFKKAQAILRESSVKPTRAPRTYLLSGAGLLRCGKCGGSMYGHTYKSSRKGEYFYYRCQNHVTMGSTACEGLSLPGEALEEFVVNTLKGLSKDNTFLSDKKKMLDALKKKVKTSSSDRSSEIDALRNEERQIQSRIDTLLEKLETRIIDDDIFIKRHSELKRLLEDNKRCQVEASTRNNTAEAEQAALQASFDEIASFERNWNALDEKGRAAMIRTIVKRITATRDKIEMDVFLDSVAKPSRRDTDSWPPPA